MRRFTVSLAMAVVFLVGVIAAMSQSTTAQDDLTAEHPIVGAWEWDNYPLSPGTELSYAIFHGDGTYVELNADGSINIGAWEPTGARTVALTARTQSTDPNTNQLTRGTLLLTGEVDETGNHITAPYSSEERNRRGDVVFTGESMALGTRTEVVPILPVGTPSAGTPTS